MEEWGDRAKYWWINTAPEKQGELKQGTANAGAQIWTWCESRHDPQTTVTSSGTSAARTPSAQEVQQLRGPWRLGGGGFGTWWAKRDGRWIENLFHILITWQNARPVDRNCDSLPVPWLAPDSCFGNVPWSNVSCPVTGFHTETLILMKHWVSWPCA